MSFLLAFKRVNSVGRNRREEQAADELRRTSAKMCFFLVFIWFKVQGSCGGFAAFGEGPRRRRRIECLEEAQLYAAV